MIWLTKILYSSFYSGYIKICQYKSCKANCNFGKSLHILDCKGKAFPNLACLPVSTKVILVLHLIEVTTNQVVNIVYFYANVLVDCKVISGRLEFITQQNAYDMIVKENFGQVSIDSFVAPRFCLTVSAKDLQIFQKNNQSNFLSYLEFISNIIAKLHLQSYRLGNSNSIICKKNFSPQKNIIIHSISCKKWPAILFAIFLKGLSTVYCCIVSLGRCCGTLLEAQTAYLRYQL